MFTNDECRLTYRVFHIYFTIPPTLILAFLTRPFLTQLERLKLILLPLVALVWTTAWDSELIRRRAWGYPRACVLGTIWRIPLEEYFFFLIQSVLTTLVTTLFTRWILPPLHMRVSKDRTSYAGTIAPLCYLGICLSGLALAFASSNEHTYYMGMILWWSSIPLLLLTWGAADHIVSICSPTTLEAANADTTPALFRTVAVLASVLVPTGYLWFADVFALRKGTWFISRHTSLEIFVIPDLPIEEATFFFVTNLILVVASFAFDRCVAIARFFPEYIDGKADTSNLAPLAPVNVPLASGTVLTMWKAFVSSLGDASKTSSAGGLGAHLAILSAASRSFNLASLLMPWDLRADLGSVYAFCRASDNLIDHAAALTSTKLDSNQNTASEAAAAKKAKRLTLLRQVVLLACGDVRDEEKEAEDGKNGMDPQQRKQLIALRIQSFARVELLPENQKIAATKEASSQFSESESGAYHGADPIADVATAASTLVDMRGLVLRELWNELFDGYAIDLGMDSTGSSVRDNPTESAEFIPPLACRMETLDDLGEYAQCVAGAVGEMCVRVVLGRVGRSLPAYEPEKRESLSEMLLAIDRHPSRTRTAKERAEAERREKEASPESILLIHARRMGVALQLINIARDVVTDSRSLGRSYLPRELFDERDAWIADALKSGSIESCESSGRSYQNGKAGLSGLRRNGSSGTVSPSLSPPASVSIEREVPPALIRIYRARLLALAQALYDSSYPALSNLPCHSARAGLRVACAVYADISTATMAQSDDQIRAGARARSSTLRRILVALRALYLS
ncbi:hypothetical protein OC861_001896 [Tilletia horrida]|nr:hypothetical protein OC861_001896 [Tilletia horrida]